MRQVIDRVADTPADPDHARVADAPGRPVARGARQAPRDAPRAARAGGAVGPGRPRRSAARIRPGSRESSRGFAACPCRRPRPQDREQHALQAALARLFERLLARYRELLAAAGGCDFRQLLEDVAQAFREEPVRRKWARRFRHVLVDEFQDTDPVQWEVLRALFGAEGLERPGLFVVGDEKQAIFSFRDGDVVTFRDAAREIVGAGGRGARARRELPVGAARSSRSATGSRRVCSRGSQRGLRGASLADDVRARPRHGSPASRRESRS